MSPPDPIRYLGYEASRSVPNIVVDGGPNDATVLALTHWPGIAQPAGLAADLSAEMAFGYLDTRAARVATGDHGPAQHAPAQVVTNNHYDQDGLVSVHALVHPESSRCHRELLVDVAAAGDFGTYRFRAAARASMAIAAYADEERSPIADDLRRTAYPEQVDLLYRETLPLLLPMVTRPEEFRELWGDEDDRLTASERALADGDVVIGEHADLDLAVVTVGADQPRRGGHRFTAAALEEIHPFAIHDATERVRLLIVHGRRYRFVDRYETWVQYRARPVPPRVDMTAAAERLTVAERGAVTWSADPPAAIMPTMRPAGESSLTPTEVLSVIGDHLRTAPAAWDPFRLAR